MLKVSGVAISVKNAGMESVKSSHLTRENLRIHYHDVSHGHERGQAGEKFSANAGAIFGQRKYAFEQFRLLEGSHYRVLLVERQFR